MRPGQLFAKPPISPYPHLTVTARAGSDSWQRPIWQVACTCGATFRAQSKPITSGTARCPTCNPRGMEQAKEILALLPAGYSNLQRKLKVECHQIDYRIRWMRKRDLCHIGGWAHPEQQGAIGPVFHAGPGMDVPCNVDPYPKPTVKRRHEKRIKRAIEKALNGGKEDPRYMRKIALSRAAATVKRTREDPQTPFSALFAAAGARHA